MTITDHRDVANWWAVPATTLDHPRVADFLATTKGLGGRKFASDSRDVAEHFDGALSGGANVVLDDTGQVRGYALLRKPHGDEVEAEFVFDPETPSAAVDEVVDSTVARFCAIAVDRPTAYLRAIVGAEQHNVTEALIRRGAWREAEFVRSRKALDAEDLAELAGAKVPGLTVLSWPALISRGLGDQVRRLHSDTFPEHYGAMSTSPEAFDRHIESRSFTPDFSYAAVDQSGVVLGYALGSTFTAGAAPNDERSAHTDYIGVREDHRRRRIAELLLRKVWLAALRRGLVVASVGVDCDNRSKAQLLYRRLGYAPVQSQYLCRIDAAKSRRF